MRTTSRGHVARKGRGLPVVGLVMVDAAAAVAAVDVAVAAKFSNNNSVSRFALQPPYSVHMSVCFSVGGEVKVRFDVFAAFFLLCIC